MIDNKNRFVIKEYDKKSPFASFFPGISGVKGIPIWCYYVNRGQCVTSFGVQDKDHSIMEFYPAHQAYQRTKRMGFRTFMKVNGSLRESFTGVEAEKEMHIGMNELVLEETDRAAGIKTIVTYYTLPEENIGGLVREVTIENIGRDQISLELVDGMTEMIPYGVDLASMKEMAQTSQAWMEVEDHKDGLAYCKVRVGMEDTAEVTAVTGGHFGFAYDGNQRLPIVVSQQTLFGYDMSCETPICFQESGIKGLKDAKQNTENHLPCCFFFAQRQLAGGEQYTIREIFGLSESKEELKKLAQKAQDAVYFDQKQKRANELTQELTARIQTKTASPVFDLYCRQTYLDNVLRGGYPITLGADKLFYVYSRKHGDIERDYNFFRMQPEYFSQGNGNFRDVNQNRRNDNAFSPEVTDQNIRLFYDAIQLNGYNPLGIEKITYRMPGTEESFTPGQKYKELLKAQNGAEDLADASFYEMMTLAVAQEKTDFIEGYWSDHWTYNLDLVESYLNVYPDCEEKLLFEEQRYRYKQTPHSILPRRERYVKTENGIRQYRYLKEETELQKSEYVCGEDGNVLTASLFDKIYLLCVTKVAALDLYGMGIEMEGGKPGWYDALNGLPGLLGSSMCEAYELERNLEFLLDMLEKYPRELQIVQEVWSLAQGIEDAMDKHRDELKKNGAQISYWNEVNDKKEAYWESAKESVHGEKVCKTAQEIVSQLNVFAKMVSAGIQKALTYGGGISPAYFYYDVTAYEEDERGILPSAVKMRMMPYFLEGPVRHLKLGMEKEKKQELYRKVKQSDLYDKKLEMYKVNASLKDASYELGRCKAFTPGWLENESIWLHMEYKYLLELLKSEMYTEYLEDFHKAAIPFLDEEMYGRSLFENSSFLASSKNPDEKIHGKGFVSRLSGSTAEFLQMWQIMMFGKQPFTYEDKKLSLMFQPLIPAYLIGKEKMIETTFRGCIPVVYHLADQEDFIPGNYRIVGYDIWMFDEDEPIQTNVIEGKLAVQIREGSIKKIVAELVRC